MMAEIAKVRSGFSAHLAAGGRLPRVREGRIAKLFTVQPRTSDSDGFGPDGFARMKSGTSVSASAVRTDKVRRNDDGPWKGGTHGASRRFSAHLVEGWWCGVGGADGAAGGRPGARLRRSPARRSSRGSTSPRRTPSRNRRQPAEVGGARLLADTYRQLLLCQSLRPTRRP